MPQVLQRKFRKFKNESNAKLLAGFFKTGPGQYGEGDRFLGIKIPVTRGFIREEQKKIDAFSLTDVNLFLESPWHEERVLGVLILVGRYEKGDEKVKERVLKHYLQAVKKGQINNWDLVDLSASYIAGEWQCRVDQDFLDSWVDSPKLWERRVAVVATHALIRAKRFEKTLEYSWRLFGDSQDLMHKACGWMLRELGKKDEKVLRKFLDQYTLKMPRTMLRYAIERLGDRKKYLEMK